MSKTLVILIGNARGGELTWNSMYKNLLLPYEADLALCFGKSNKRCSLHQKCKYFWEVPEYSDWTFYIKEKYNNFIFKTFLLRSVIDSGTSGGILNFFGSGAIIFSFRDIILNQYKNILEKYDRIILTRSDFFYFKSHPLLNVNNPWVIEGEEYGGISDRHQIFSPEHLNQFLGILEYMDSEEGFESIKNLILPNPESILNLFYNHTGIIKKIKKIPRVQFVVATKEDESNWTSQKILVPFCQNLYLKYPSEIENILLYKQQSK